MFAPHGGQWLRRVGIWDYLFRTSPTCSQSTEGWLHLPGFSEQQGVRLRWPLLVPLEVLGVVVGLMGWRLLRRRSMLLWASSFLWFATMNTAAFLCHNWLSFRGSAPDPVCLPHQLAVAVDVGCTAAACCQAARAVLQDGGKRAAHTPSQAAAVGPRMQPPHELPALLLLAVAISGNVLQVRSCDGQLGRRCETVVVGLQR